MKSSSIKGNSFTYRKSFLQSFPSYEKRMENMYFIYYICLPTDQLQMVTCWPWLAHLSDHILSCLGYSLECITSLSLFHFRRIICASQSVAGGRDEGKGGGLRIRDADALGQSWPRFWLIEYTALALALAGGEYEKWRKHLGTICRFVAVK